MTAMDNVSEQPARNSDVSVTRGLVIKKASQTVHERWTVCPIENVWTCWLTQAHCLSSFMIGFVIMYISHEHVSDAVCPRNIFQFLLMLFVHSPQNGP